MNILSFFQENKLEDESNDEEECDKMCQLLIEMTKLVALVEDQYKSKIDEYFDKLKANIETLTVIFTNGFQMVSLFDYKDLKYNGYRSIFKIIKKCMQHISSNLIKLLNSLSINRMKYEKKSKEYIQFLFQLTFMAKHLFQLMIVQKNNKSLFLQKQDHEEIYSTIIDSYDLLESDVFYGQCLGFYMCKPCQMIAKVFCSIELGMGQAMSLPKSNVEVFMSTVVNSAQSWWMEHKRGAQMANLFRQATVKFCKQFWNLVDHPILISSSHLVLPNLKVIKSITLQPILLLMPSVSDPDKSVEVSPPTDNEGFAEVKIRLLSKTRRRGMKWITNGNSNASEDTAEPSPCLLIHIHGGGFVAQSSQSHDAYLRQWAIDLNYPIVSIDYSHAPEFPFPRAHEECLYAYAWILNNLSDFGCKPDCRIVICGDSAGGNLALGCVLRVLQLDIRAPDGVFLAYPVTLVNFSASPSRVIGAFCPILPIGVIARCLLAYLGVDEESLVEQIAQNSQSASMDSIESSASKQPPNKYTDNDFLERDTFDSGGSRIFFSPTSGVSPLVLLQHAEVQQDPIISPFLATDSLLRKLPPLTIFACEFDPLLDDSVEFCKLADRAGAQDVRLKVMRELPHGFLNMATPMTKDCLSATKQSIEEIRRLLVGLTDIEQ